MKQIVLIAIPLLFVFTSCGQRSQSISYGQQLKTVGVDEFEKQIVAVQGEQLVDVRTPQEFAESHIKGAINIDFRNPIFSDEINKLDKTKPLLIYCRSGRRSGDALSVCKNLGFTTVYDLSGGIIAWQQAEKPEEK